MFRVAADQLKLRGGIVRCGACTEIFDGNAALVDLATAARPAPPPRRRRASDTATAGAAADAATAPRAEAPAAPAEQAAGDPPIYTLEFDRTFAPYGILPQAGTGEDGNAAPVTGLAPEPAPAPEASTEAGTEASTEASTEAGPEAAPQAIPESLAEAPPEAVPDAAPDADLDASPAATAGPLAEPAPAPAPAPAPDPQVSAEAPPASPADLQVDEELVAAAAPHHDETPEQAATVPAPAPAAASAPPSAKAGTAVPPLLLRESGPATVTMPAPPSAPPVAPRSPRAKAAEARAARKSKLTPTKIEPPKLRVPEPDEPEFVRRGRQRERSGKAVRIATIAGSVLLLLVLAAQVAMHFGTPLAARYPVLKPALVSLCGLLGCRIGLPAQIDQLVIDTGELTTLGGNAYTFTTQLRNQGEAVQAWPSIELTLSDAEDRPLVRRVFGPRDYLPAGPLLDAGFGAHAEQPVKLHFRVEEPAPSGYHIAVFYP